MSWIEDIISPKTRKWEEFYRNRWQYDKVVRSTHGVNCTGGCSWNIHVKDGIVVWEMQALDYPLLEEGLPPYEPRGCQRGISYSWYLYSPIRVKYPLMRGALLDIFREEKEKFRFLHVSTDEVFGSLGPEGHFNETTAYDPSSPYSASKAGVHMMARHMAHHLVKENININTIAPGPFESKMMSYMLDNPKRRAGVVASTPQGRIGTPEDITGAVIFLASRASAWLTGITLPVDGGISTHG